MALTNVTSVKSYLEEHYEKAGLELVNKLGSPEEAAALDPLALKSEVIRQTNAFLIYANQKNEVSSEDLATARREGHIGKISTAHPIGNSSVTQAFAGEYMARIITKKFKQGISENEGYKKEKYLNPDFEANQVAKMKQEVLDKIATTKGLSVGQELTARISFSKTDTFDALFGIIAEIHIREGIKNKVVTRKQQSTENESKMSLLANAGERPATWLRADGDGDKGVDATGLFGDWIIGKTLKEIFETVVKDENRPVEPFIYMARTSCDDNKRDVTGLPIQLNNLPGVKDITDITDIFGDSRQKLKEKFLNHLKDLRYNDFEKGSPTPANFPLNTIIMNVILPAFKHKDGTPFAAGSVLSDFPEDPTKAKKLLAQLAFVKDAVAEYLGVEKIDNVFLPLCENKQAVENFSIALNGKEKDGDKPAVKGFFKTIIDTVKSAGSEAEQIDIINRLITKDGDRNVFIVGGFPGPSDLTKRMGDASIMEMTLSYLQSEKDFAAFQETIKNIVGEDVYKTLSISSATYCHKFGKGTSPRRGEGYTLFDSTRTVQGTTPASVSSGTQKRYESAQALAMMAMDENPDAKAALYEELLEYKKMGFIEEANQHHLKFYNEEQNGIKKGIIVGELDRLKDEFIFSPARSNNSGNQGCRGASTPDADVPLRNQIDTRAIGAALTTTFSGLLTSSGFPEDMDKMKSKGFKLDKFVNQSFGLRIFANTIQQLASSDSKRARELGISEGAIAASEEHFSKLCNFFAKEVNSIADNDVVKLPKDLTTKDGKNDFINNLLGAMINNGVVKNPYLRNRLELIKAQTPLIIEQSELLTQSIVNIKNYKGLPIEDKELSFYDDVKKYDTRVIKLLKERKETAPEQKSSMEEYDRAIGDYSSRLATAKGRLKPLIATAARLATDLSNIQFGGFPTIAPTGPTTEHATTAAIIEGDGAAKAGAAATTDSATTAPATTSTESRFKRATKQKLWTAAVGRPDERGVAIAVA